MKRKILALTLALSMILGSTSMVYATETEETHNETSYGKKVEKDVNCTYTPKIHFFKCIGQTQDSLTFALSTSCIKTVKQGTKVKTEEFKPDYIDYECVDLDDDEAEVVVGQWSPSSLSKVTLALGTKLERNGSKVSYKKATYLANGIDSSGKTSGGYTISGLQPGHKYSITITVWNKGSNNLVHYLEDGSETPCTYFDTKETTVYKAVTTSTVATAPKDDGEFGVEAYSTRITKINSPDQRIFVAWDKISGISKYGYIVSYLKDGELQEYKGNYTTKGVNPDLNGNTTGAYIKVPSNKVSKLTLYSIGNVYGLRKFTNTIGAEKIKASYFDWYLAPTTSTAKAIEIIPQVQVKTAINKSNKIKVTWSKIDGLEPSDKYVIYCSEPNNANSFKKVATVGSDTSTYTITKVGKSNIDSKKNYYVYIVAVDSSVELPEDDIDIDVDAKQVKSMVNYSYRATPKGTPNLVGKR